MALAVHLSDLLSKSGALDEFDLGYRPLSPLTDFQGNNDSSRSIYPGLWRSSSDPSPLSIHSVHILEIGPSPRNLEVARRTHPLLLTIIDFGRQSYESLLTHKTKLINLLIYVLI